MSLESLTKADFEPHVGTDFDLGVAEFGPLRLTAVEAHGEGAPGGRDAFSLLFHGPAGDWLPQRIYALEHPAMGRLEIFLVPLGPDDSGHRYEAAFN